MSKDNYFVRLVKCYKTVQSLDSLAEKLGKPVSVVKKDIARLQSAGLKIRTLGRRKKAIGKETDNGCEIGNVQAVVVPVMQSHGLLAGRFNDTVSSNHNGNVVVEEYAENQVVFGPTIPEYEMLKWRAKYTVFGMVSHYGEGSGI